MRTDHEVQVRFKDGRPADKIVVKALNPPEARDRAERLTGGTAGGCRRL